MHRMRVSILCVIVSVCECVRVWVVNGSAVVCMCTFVVLYAVYVYGCVHVICGHVDVQWLMHV